MCSALTTAKHSSFRYASVSAKTVSMIAHQSRVPDLRHLCHGPSCWHVKNARLGKRKGIKVNWVCRCL